VTIFLWLKLVRRIIAYKFLLYLSAELDAEIFNADGSSLALLFPATYHLYSCLSEALPEHGLNPSIGLCMPTLLDNDPRFSGRQTIVATFDVGDHDPAFEGGYPQRLAGFLGKLADAFKPFLLDRGTPDIDRLIADHKVELMTMRTRIHYRMTYAFRSGHAATIQLSC